MTVDMVYVPRIYGFKIFRKKGSKYCEEGSSGKKLEEISFYSEQNLKKMKGLVPGV